MLQNLAMGIVYDVEYGQYVVYWAYKPIYYTYHLKIAKASLAAKIKGWC